MRDRQGAGQSACAKRSLLRGRTQPNGRYPCRCLLRRRRVRPDFPLSCLCWMLLLMVRVIPGQDNPTAGKQPVYPVRGELALLGGELCLQHVARGVADLDAHLGRRLGGLVLVLAMEPAAGTDFRPWAAPHRGDGARACSGRPAPFVPPGTAAMPRHGARRPFQPTARRLSTADRRRDAAAQAAPGRPQGDACKSSPKDHHSP